MPHQKDLKRLVRARMQKTGERYATARMHVIAETDRRAGRSTTDYAALAGMSDEKVKAATGLDWAKWVKSLDQLAAGDLPHRDIVKLIKEKYDTPSWWTQTVTVGYERIKGMREIGQQRSGTFAATKSKTFPVPVASLYNAWADARTRNRWLHGVKVKVRTASVNKSMRLDWPDGGIIAVGFTSKGAGKSMVALEHAKLPSRAAADELKAFWSDRLAQLATVVAPD